jgi:hypothetical protein
MARRMARARRRARTRRSESGEREPSLRARVGGRSAGAGRVHMDTLADGTWSRQAATSKAHTQPASASSRGPGVTRPTVVRARSTCEEVTFDVRARGGTTHTVVLWLCHTARVYRLLFIVRIFCNKEFELRIMERKISNKGVKIEKTDESDERRARENDGCCPCWMVIMMRDARLKE